MKSPQIFSEGKFQKDSRGEKALKKKCQNNDVMAKIQVFILHLPQPFIFQKRS